MKQKPVRRARVVVDNEPTWDSKEKPTEWDIVRALNWYGANKDEKDAAKYLNLPASTAKNNLVLAWVTRMIARGCVLPKGSKASYASRMAELNTENKKVEKTVATNVISIQDRIRMKSEEIIGELEGLVDEFGMRGKASQMNAYQHMIDSDVKSVHANRIAEHFRQSSEEVLLAASGKDKELVEGYSTYTKARLLNLLQCYAAIVKDAERLAKNTATARKPRKKKAVSFDKKVAKLNYLEREDSLKLQSVSPVKIIGAQQLWVYNAKTRKLGVYNALDAAGLDVKGSTIQNFGKDSSISKHLRKPEKVLTTVTTGGKIALRRVMDGIKAKELPLNGRINKDTLILRVS